MYTIEDQIKDTLNKIRPFIQRDGGDVEYVDYKDGVVFIRVLGACLGCAFIDDTISGGVEMILCEEVPGVVRVQVVE